MIIHGVCRMTIQRIYHSIKMEDFSLLQDLDTADFNNCFVTKVIIK